MSDKSVFLALRISKHGHGEACLCSSREEAEQKLFEIIMPLYAHEHATLKAVKNCSDLAGGLKNKLAYLLKCGLLKLALMRYGFS
jgi:hypothetical protein